MKTKEISEQNLETLSKNLKDVLKLKTEQTTPKNIMLYNALLLSFPFSMVQSHLENIEKDLKEYLGHVGPYGFLEFVRNLSTKYIKENRMSYVAIVREIFSNLTKYQGKLTLPDTLDILDSLQNMHFRNISVFNSIFDVNNYFLSFLCFFFLN